MKAAEKKSRAQRHEARILRWALAYCAADNRYQQGWPQWRSLSERHFPGAVCFQPQEQTEDQDDPCAVDARDALPREEWCGDCVDFIDNGIDYKEALYQRRKAKAYMKRAYRELILATRT